MLVEFDDGFRVITSRWAVRKRKEEIRTLFPQNLPDIVKKIIRARKMLDKAPVPKKGRIALTPAGILDVDTGKILKP